MDFFIDVCFFFVDICSDYYCYHRYEYYSLLIVWLSFFSNVN